MNGWEVTTIEKVGTPKAPHPIQSAFVKHSASQCGALTPKSGGSFTNYLLVIENVWKITIEITIYSGKSPFIVENHH